MISLAALIELYEYNYRAQHRQLEACALLTQEQYERELTSSFPSVRDTLAHLVDGEEYALHRWQGDSREEIIAAMGFAGVDERKRLWPEQFPTFSVLRSRAEEVEAEVRGYLKGLTEEEIGRAVRYVDRTGRAWDYPLGRLLMHHILHQTYHRGQITTLLRQLGVQPAKIDYLDMFDGGGVAGMVG